MKNKTAELLVNEKSIDVGGMYDAQAANKQSNSALLLKHVPEADKLPSWEVALKTPLRLVAIKGTSIKKTGGKVVRRVIGENKSELFTVSLYEGRLVVLRLPKAMSEESDLGAGYSLRDVETVKGKIALPLLTLGRAHNHAAYKKELGSFADLAKADKVEVVEPAKAEKKKPSSKAKKIAKKAKGKAAKK